MTVFFMCGLIWKEFQYMYGPDKARSATLISYTILGVSSYLFSLSKNLPNIKKISLTLLGLVALRLLSVEVWSMSLVERISTFILIGLILMGTALFEKKHQIKNLH